MNEVAIRLNETKTLPDGWQWVKLGKVIKEPLRNGLNFKGEDFGKGIKFVNVADIFCPQTVETGKLGRINGISPQEISKCQLRTGDILIVRSSLKKEGVAYPALFVEEKEPVVFCGFLIRIRPDSQRIDPSYLFWYLRSTVAREKLVGSSDTVTITNVDQGTLLSLDIPLPAVPEQKRLVAKIQESMEEVEHARAACEAQLEAAQALPQAYLRQVFESEEAKKWERWRLGEICEVVTGNTPSKNNPENYGDYLPWVKPEDLDKEMYVKDTTEYLSVLGARQARVLPRGAIMVSCIGNLGKIAIAGCNLATNQQINSLIPKPEVDSEHLYFGCATIQNALEKLAASTTLKIVNKTAFASITIPFPSLPEQQQIASELKDKMASAEELKADIVKQLEAIKALPQAILRKAFRGEL